MKNTGWKEHFNAGTAGLFSLVMAIISFVLCVGLQKYRAILGVAVIIFSIIGILLMLQHFKNIKGKKLPSAMTRGKFRFFEH